MDQINSLNVSPVILFNENSSVDYAETIQTNQQSDKKSTLDRLTLPSLDPQTQNTTNVINTPIDVLNELSRMQSMEHLDDFLESSPVNASDAEGQSILNQSDKYKLPPLQVR